MLKGIFYLFFLISMASVSAKSVEVSSLYHRLLFHLAGQAFENDYSQKPQNIIANILTCHLVNEGKKIKRYTDGKFLVVSFPIHPKERELFCNYLAHYNKRNLDLINSFVKKEQYELSEKFLTLLLEFDAAQDMSHTILRKMIYLKKIQNGEKRYLSYFESKTAECQFGKNNMLPLLKINDLSNLGIEIEK